LDSALRRYPAADLARSVTRLTTRYREGTAATEPIMKSDLDVAAYAGYRMPATYAAVHAVLTEVERLTPEFGPTSLLDIGGGTGTVLWAAAETWPSLTELTVVEQVPNVLALGRKLASTSDKAAVRKATWRRGVIDPGSPATAVDLVTLSYVLGELPEAMRDDTVRWLAATGGMVVIVEPGTPAGYERVVRARDVLQEAGLHITAPCPHERECPVRGNDWCHFAARLPRVGHHQVIKEGTLNFEDEKFAYVAAAPADHHRRAANRVVRHPLKRKGMVQLRLCTGEGTLEDQVVSKRHGELYRDARDTTWGDEWPNAE
jgi:ribosomal protein RSM22 (predicted rRNA methylase)